MEVPEQVVTPGSVLLLLMKLGEHINSELPGFSIPCLGSAPGDWRLSCEPERDARVVRFRQRLAGIGKTLARYLSPASRLPPELANFYVDATIDAIGSVDGLLYRSYDEALERRYDELIATLRLAQSKPADQNRKLCDVRAMEGISMVAAWVDEALRPVHYLVISKPHIDCRPDLHATGPKHRGVKALSVTVRINLPDLTIARKMERVMRQDAEIAPNRIEII
ncbi:hypothetical protein WME94_34295 [Sorangium sp. So ce429]